MGQKPALPLAGRAFLIEMTKIVVSVLMSVLFMLVPSGAFADLKVLEGEHTVIYDIVNPRDVAVIIALNE